MTRLRTSRREIPDRTCASAANVPLFTSCVVIVLVLLGCVGENSESLGAGAAAGSTTGSGSSTNSCAASQYACGEQCCDCPQPGLVSSQPFGAPISRAHGADLDGDGQMELVVAWQGGGLAALAANTCGVFELIAEIPAIQLTGLDTGNIDGAVGDDVITFEDSMVLSAWGGTDLHALWNGELTGISGAGEVLAVQMDSDGDHDVAAFQPNNGKLLRVENTGSSWNVKVGVTLPNDILRVAAGDLGGGPRDEILFMGGALVQVVSVADFNFSDIRPLSGQDSWDAAFGDFDADGLPDAAVANTSGVTLWHGDGATKLKSAATAKLPMHTATVAAYDGSGDGSPEVVALDSSGTLRILASTTLQVSEEVFMGADAFALAVGDVNGDNREDIVAIGSEGLVYLRLTP